MMEIWDNTHMCVFMVRDEGPPVYLPCTGISSIEWSVTKGICQYCGSAMEGNKCPNCAGSVTSSHSLGQAIVTLEGVLPQAVSIFHLPEGAGLLLCNKCHGDDRYNFEVGEVIMRFLHCSQVAKRMPNVAALYPEQEERLRLFVSVECEVELYPEGMEDT